MDLTEVHKIRDYLIALKDESVYSKYVTTGLFYELNKRDNSTAKALFTVKDRDWTNRAGERFISARRLFLEFNDPTGYEFAINVLGSWKHFRMLEEGVKTKAMIQEWKDELEAKLHAEEIQHIRSIASGSSANSYQAAKFLATKEYKEKAKKGAPKREDVTKEAKAQAALEKEIADTESRLNLN